MQERRGEDDGGKGNHDGDERSSSLCLLLVRTSGRGKEHHKSTVGDFGIFQSINGLLTRHPIARQVTKRNGSLRNLHLCTIVSVYENQFEISRVKSTAVNIEAAHTPGLGHPEEVGARVFREPDVLI
jgi:hypothetical protein